MVDVEQPVATGNGASASTAPDQPRAPPKRYRRVELDDEEERRRNLLEQEEGCVKEDANPLFVYAQHHGMKKASPQSSLASTTCKHVFVSTQG